MKKKVYHIEESMCFDKTASIKSDIEKLVNDGEVILQVSIDKEAKADISSINQLLWIYKKSIASKSKLTLKVTEGSPIETLLRLTKFNRMLPIQLLKVA